MIRARPIAILAVMIVGLACCTPSSHAARQDQAKPPPAGTKKVPPARGAREASAPVVGTDDSLDRPIKDKWALIVGVSRFADSSINLRYADKDASDFYNFLVERANFAPDHVKLLVNEQATRAQILSALGTKWLSRVANPDDLVVIYISTHGSPLDPMVGDVNYLIAHDTDKHDLLATGIAMQDIGRILKGRVHAERIAMFLDACYSGTVAPEGKGIVRQGNASTDELTQGRGHLVISSSLPNQISWESKGYDNSVFTRRLIEGLSVNGQDTRLIDAFEHMKDQVQEQVLRERAVLQTPMLRGKWRGNELVIAVPALRPRPALPDDPAATAPDSAPSPHTAAPTAEPAPPPDQPRSADWQPAVPPAPSAGAISVNPGPTELPRRLVVFKVRGSLPWQASNYVNKRYLNGDDVSSIPAKLSRALVEQLAAANVVEVNDATAMTALEASGGTTDDAACRKLGQSVKARYLLDTIVNTFKFNLSVLTGNTYDISITATVVNGETGKPVWLEQNHHIKEMTWVKDQVMGARGYLDKVLIQHVARYIADEALKHISEAERAAVSP